MWLALVHSVAGCPACLAPVLALLPSLDSDLLLAALVPLPIHLPPQVRGMLAQALEKALGEAAGAGLEPSTAAAAAEAVEAALLEVHGSTTKEYAERARTLTFNLKVCLCCYTGRAADMWFAHALSLFAAVLQPLPEAAQHACSTPLSTPLSNPLSTPRSTPLKAAARTCLQADGNAELRGHVLKSEIAPHVFVHMTSEELASKARGYCCWCCCWRCRSCCRCCWCCGLEGVATCVGFACWAGPPLNSHLAQERALLHCLCACAACSSGLLANLHNCLPTHLILLCSNPDHATQDLQRWRQNVRQESLRQAVLPPDVAARISTAAAVQMKREG